MRTRQLVLGAVLVALTVLPGCGSDGEDATAPTTTARPATVSSAPSTTTSTAAAATQPFTVWFVRGEKVAAAQVEAAPTSGETEAALRALLTAPVPEGLSTEIPAGTALRGVRTEAGTAIVDLSRSFESGGGSLSMQLRVAQVVFTATGYGDVDRVTITLDGQPVDGIGGEGVPARDLRRSDFEDQTPGINVEVPAQGASIRSPAVIRGTANVFEARFRLTVTDWDGRIVVDQPVQATSGTGTRGTFEVRVSWKTDRTGPGAVIAWQDSPKGDGSRDFLVEIPVTVEAS